MGSYSTARPGSTAASGERRRKIFAERERRLAALVDQQHGVVSRSQLVDLGFSVRTIGRRLESERLVRLHREVYAVSGVRITRPARWLAAVVACGASALLSHRSAAELWGLTRPRSRDIEVTSPTGRGRPGLAVHEGGVDPAERAAVKRIPVTSVARTLFDLAEVVDERALGRAFEEADRLGLLELGKLEDVCARGRGRRALRPVRRLIDEARQPVRTRTDLEERFALFCRERSLPEPETNVEVLGRETDACWPAAKVLVELDSWSFHRHRGAFEDDRVRDSAVQAAGYRVLRVTWRRLDREPEELATQLRRLLGPAVSRAKPDVP